MRSTLKKIAQHSPLFVKKSIVLVREIYYRVMCSILEKKEYTFVTKTPTQIGSKKRILVYHITGLLFGGTEKNLQIIANDLASDYEVFYMYSNIENKATREEFMDRRITLIPFTFSQSENEYPYYIHNMNPHIKNVITEHVIDMIIVSESGHTIYPILNIQKTPIIMVNNFGSPTLQENIVHINYVSDTVRTYAQSYTGDSMKYSVLNTPTTGVTAKNEVRDFRKEFGIPAEDFVFGRIGRNSDSIFDPIGIRAFQKILKEYPTAKYLIMAPPPILEKIVHDEHIPNVYFIKPSYDEKDVWAFHYAIDCLAHFRFDGETLGLNIAESMMVGNPIISHKSTIWNAHTEYLDTTFSRVTEIGDSDMYANYMKEFITIKNTRPLEWQAMRDSSYKKGRAMFSKEDYMKKFKEIIKEHLH